MKFQHTVEFTLGIPLFVKSLVAEILPRGMGKTIAIEQIENTKNPLKLRKVLQYQHVNTRATFLLKEIIKHSDILNEDNLTVLQRVVYRTHYNRMMDEYRSLTEQRDGLAKHLKLHNGDRVSLTTILMTAQQDKP